MFGGAYGGGFGGGGSSDPFGMLGAGFAGRMPPGFGANRFGASASAFDEYLTAYSMAMLPGEERDVASYGGKIVLPNSALLKITDLELESPYLFKLRNPNLEVGPKGTLPEDEGNDAGEGSSRPRFRGRETHAGVLEFIADEGKCNLPAWMMKSLGLQEGDQIRVMGTTLPKGKFVKIQPQTVDFLEISDPKAVLEQALRNFATLTPGDIIEFKYNCLTFEVLIMEVKPDAAGINILDTDLEVDFAPPKGYVEPEAKPRPPPATMASKLNIETKKMDSIPASGSSTPATMGSRRESDGMLAAPAGPFRGSGQTLSGKKSKGKKDKAIEKVDPFSLVRRTDVPRIVTNDTQLEERKIPAALNLEFGKLFFGYEYIPPGGKQEDKENTSAKQISFSGTGNTLSGRPPRRRVEDSAPSAAAAGSSSSTAAPAEGSSSSSGGSAVPFSGEGHTLGNRGPIKRSRDKGTSSSRSTRQRSEEKMELDK